MPSMINKIVGRCFTSSVQHDQSPSKVQVNESPRKKEGLCSEEMYFIIPSRDFLQYEFRKPEPGPELSVGEYMYIYRYLTAAENFKQPGPDHKWVMYFFRDRSSIHLLKGWVPTRKGYELYKQRERSFLASITSNAEINLKPFDKMTILGSKFLEMETASVEEFKNKNKTKPPSVNPCFLERKSAYNWGVISNWSRHIAPESSDSIPFEMSTTAYSSKSMDKLTKEIHAVIEGKSIKRDRSLRGCNKQAMVTSTIDTRNRKIRPGAAKGARKPPVLNDKFKSF